MNQLQLIETMTQVHIINLFSLQNDQLVIYFIILTCECIEDEAIDETEKIRTLYM